MWQQQQKQQMIWNAAAGLTRLYHQQELQEMMWNAAAGY
jgi:hypothetical protein